MATIEIRVDGAPALTTAMAAGRYGYSLATMRKEIQRREVPVAAHLDARTPLYAVRALDVAMRPRPAVEWRSDPRLTHLRDDAPSAECDVCHRHTWSASEFGGECRMVHQPGGPICAGTMRPAVD